MRRLEWRATPAPQCSSCCWADDAGETPKESSCQPRPAPPIGVRRTSPRLASSRASPHAIRRNQESPVPRRPTDASSRQRLGRTVPPMWGAHTRRHWEVPRSDPATRATAARPLTAAGRRPLAPQRPARRPAPAELRPLERHPAGRQPAERPPLVRQPAVRQPAVPKSAERIRVGRPPAERTQAELKPAGPQRSVVARQQAEPPPSPAPPWTAPPWTASPGELSGNAMPTAPPPDPTRRGSETTPDTWDRLRVCPQERPSNSAGARNWGKCIGCPSNVGHLGPKGDVGRRHPLRRHHVLLYNCRARSKQVGALPARFHKALPHRQELSGIWGMRRLKRQTTENIWFSPDVAAVTPTIRRAARMNESRDARPRLHSTPKITKP